MKGRGEREIPRKSPRHNSHLRKSWATPPEIEPCSPSPSKIFCYHGRVPVSKAGVTLTQIGYGLQLWCPKLSFLKLPPETAGLNTVALVDTLASLGIHPDGMLGHSVGELGCAYADGAFTAEQAVLAAYWRGRVICDASLPPGAMAAVGLTWEEAKSRCPEDVSPACHNSADNVTVSGTVESVRVFVQQLKEEGVFAREVDSSGIAFHSSHIAQLGPALRKHLEKLVPSPKQRSHRWVSTSVSESLWQSPLARFSSPAYHVNNLLSPVLFREALAQVPDNAVVVEVAPHCLLQAILRRALPATCVAVGLAKRLHPDNLHVFLAGLGRMFNAGLHPKLGRLYHKVKYPVGRGTPMIAPLVQWDHSTEWAVAKDVGKRGVRSGECIMEVNLSKEEDKYLFGHEIDGRLICPATGYMTLVWKTFARLQGKSLGDLAVVLEDVQFHRATILPKEGAVRFLVNVLDGTGAFEVCESGSVAATGRVRPLSESDAFLDSGDPDVGAAEAVHMTGREVYRALKLRGYDYSGVFKGIASADTDGVRGELLWKKNWVSFMDTVLQFSLMGEDAQGLYLPARLQKVVIDPRVHSSLEEDALVPVSLKKNVGVVRAGGVEMRGLHANLAPRRQRSQAPPKLEKYAFVPYQSSSGNKTMDDVGKDLEQALTVILQVVLENSGGAMKLRVAEVAGDSPPEALLSPLVVNIFHGEPMTNVSVLNMLPS
ncbi:hypothetical protein PR048_010559 [Dryococelus australis]|uniref:PKS/mFAS DH domain-containing protein n=1 Tax=Dryococelus australis TaxID=614101 RepID=A0ABQ9I326_9NEOP|nr:hypothetical protein PR048_010559 [Dryococelus australis]